jgi:hypothetical protein
MQLKLIITNANEDGRNPPETRTTSKSSQFTRFNPGPVLFGGEVREREREKGEDEYLAQKYHKYLFLAKKREHLKTKAVSSRIQIKRERQNTPLALSQNARRVRFYHRAPEHSKFPSPTRHSKHFSLYASSNLSHIFGFDFPCHASASA